MSNPFVVGATSVTTPFSGAGLLEDGASLKAAIDGGDWLSGGLSAVSAVADTASAVMNPIAALVSWGVGWLLDHLEPLKGWLNKLTGDAGAVAGAGATWANIAGGLQTAAGDLLRSLTSTLAQAQSEAVAAYKVLMADVGDHISMASELSNAISNGLSIASGIVQVVHDLVRDAISDVVGYAVSCIVPLPNVIASVISKVWSWVNRLIDKIGALVRSFDSLKGLFRQVDDLMARLKSVLDRIRRGFLGDDVPSGRPRTDSPDVDSPVVPPGSSPGDGPSVPSSKDCTRVGEPVDAATGWVFSEHTDVELAGVFPLVLRRRYVSGFRFGRSFGTRWASTLDEHLDTANGRLALVRWDASVLVFPPVADGGEVTPLAGPDRWRLARGDVGSYTVLDPVAGITYRFAGAGRRKWLVEQRDRAGRWVQFHRNHSGLVTKVVHHGGYQVLVIASGSRVAALDLATAEGPVRLATFDYRHGSLIAETPAGAGTTRYEVDEVDRISAWVDANDVRYRHHYDDRDRCVSQGTENAGHERVHRYAYTYSDGPLPGGQTMVVHYPNGANERYESDQDGRVVRVVGPLGGVTQHTFDQWGRRTSVTDPLGHTATFSYDEASRITRAVGPDGATTTVEYDETGLARRIVDPAGGVRLQEFDAGGELVRRVDPDGAVRSWAYSTSDPGFTWTDPTGREVVVDADPAGLPIAVTDAAGTARVVRDELGRIVELIDPVGAATGLTWSVQGWLLGRRDATLAEETWRYDGRGNLVEAVDASGRVTRYDYGPFDVLTRRLAPDGGVVRLAYDDQCRLLAVTNQIGSTWSYERDLAGKVVVETDYDGRRTAFAYDLAGRVTTSISPTGDRTSYDLDPAGRVVGLDAAGTELAFRYDPLGNLLSAASPTDELTRELDRVGRLLTETVDGATTTWQRDEAGRVLERRTPAGVVSDWTLDASGRRTGLDLAGTQVGFRLDDVGRIVTADFVGGAIESAYDPLGRLTRRTVAGAGETDWQVAYDYTSSGELATVWDSTAGVRRLELDLSGRVTAITGDGMAAEVYRYDPADNLTHAAWLGANDTASSGQGAREFRGSLLVRAGRDQFDHDAAGRLVRRRRGLLSGGSKEWTYCWNALDQLVTVTTPEGHRWHYRYDALGRRTGKTHVEPDGSEIESYRYHWDGSVLAEQVHATPATATTTTWEHDGFTPIAETRARRPGNAAEWTREEVDAEFSAIITDQVGTPLRMIGVDGDTTWASRPTLWGVTEADPVMPLRFPGQYHDAETGLFYNLNRYYDPATGRYLTQDPLGLEPAPNPSTYPANPTVEIDPLGLSSNGTDRTSITYLGQKLMPDGTVRPYVGYASMPGSRVPEEVLRYRYSDWTTTFSERPEIAYSGEGVNGKQTARGLEQRYYEELVKNGPVANRQNPVGVNNANRDNYLQAADQHLAATPCS